MKFNLADSMRLLESTPGYLQELLIRLPGEWTSANEGEGTWNVSEVLGHLIHCEQSDWIPRTGIILSDGTDKRFEPVDRQAHIDASKGKTIEQLLAEFAAARRSSLARLQSMNLSEKDFDRTGIHPAFGAVTLSQLLATWVVHDLDHLSQIARVMAKQYKDAVGPWASYLRIVS